MSTNGANELALTIRRLVAWVRHMEEQCAARVLTLNTTIETLLRSPGLPPLVMLGDPILEVDRTTNSDQPPTAILQPAFIVPHGLGAVRWELATLADLNSEGVTLESVAPQRFTSYPQCDPDLQAMLLRHLVGLLARVEAKLSDGEAVH
jgi:hypothetical protein